MPEDEGKKLRVLVVDDAAMIVRVLTEMLRSIGVERADAAASGEEAVGLLSRNRYDLVLSDVLMPGMGGVGLVKHIREAMGDAELPVYAVTSDSLSIDAFRAQGFTAVFVKPFTRANVAALLRRTRRRGEGE